MTHIFKNNACEASASYPQRFGYVVALRSGTNGQRFNLGKQLNELAIKLYEL